jgi:hypothetical protein
MKLTEDEELREKIRLKCLNDWDIELSEDQITMGIIEQEEQKLSIFHNQLWPNKRNYKKSTGPGYDDFEWCQRVTWDKTIDGYRTIALRNEFAGIEPTKFIKSDSKLVMATVTVYKIQSDGKRYPFVGEARFDEFAPRNRKGDINLTGQWKTAPYNQLSIAAQRQALRLAFQECNDNQTELLVAPDTAADVPEPDPEPSRGESVPTHESEPPAPEPEQPKGKFVGIPRDGFKFGQMYNEQERIVIKTKMSEGSHQDCFLLALDSGVAVMVSPDGYETSRRDRTDDNPGGRPWKEGKKYYGEEVIEKIAEAKKDSKSLWLALDNGFKVKVDQWGREIKKKERKKKDDSKKEEGSKGDGLMSISDFRQLSAIEAMRKNLLPALAQWCRDVNDGKKISLKTAHAQLNGVTFEDGKGMSIEDFPVLYECLVEALEEHAKSAAASN